MWEIFMPHPVHTVTERAFGLTKTMFIDTADRTVKSVMNAEHFTIILRITLNR
jgi:hypothetical protein